MKQPSGCIYCGTELVATVRGRVCPQCSGGFIEELKAIARATLGIRQPELNDRGNRLKP